MSDYQLNPTEVAKIAGNFIMHSPPGQTQKVVEDLRTLAGPGILEKRLPSMVAKVNQEKFLAVEEPGGRKVLLTTYGATSDEAKFKDPSGKQLLVVDHLSQKCTGVEPWKPEPSVEAQRKAIDDAMAKYASEWLPDAVVTTYGDCDDSTGQIKVTCCIGRCNLNLKNYWAGLWRSTWTLEMSEGAKQGKLKGSVHCDVHYFEDGNVQLDDATNFSCVLPLTGKIGEDFSKQVQVFETGFMTKMEEIYGSMSEMVLQGLRRRLPVTRQKFDWDNKAAVHNLAKDLNSQRMQS